MKTPRHFVIEQVIANIVINFSIVFYLNWRAMAHLATVPHLAPPDAPFAPNMAGDILVGSFILALVLSLILTAITRHNLRKGAVAPAAAGNVIGRLPASNLLRSLVLAVFATLCIALPVVVLFPQLGIHELPSKTYIVWHACYAAALAALMAYIVVVRALADDVRAQ